MTKKKLSFKKWLSMLLTAVMLVAALPISAFAAPASGIPANMLDNVYLDALAYTGYNVQAQKDDGTIFIKTGSSVSASIRSGIGYGTGPSGLETNSGGVPDIARFRSHGLCCASYVSYVYYNYMPNVAHINTATVPCPSNPRSATAYNTAANGWVESGKARRISFTQSSDGSNFNPSEEIPIGSLIVFKHIPTGSVAHVAIYAGYYNGKHFVTHVGNDRGPEFSTIVGMSKGDYPEAVVQVVVPEFVEAYGSIEVQKNDTNGKGLAGAYFVATSQKDGTQYLIGPTDAGGHGSSIERIPYGQYTVKETVFPANYRAYGQTEWTVTVSAANNGVARFTAVNEEIPGNVKIVKESEDGRISGIRLNISGNGVNEDVVTGSDGSITVKEPVQTELTYAGEQVKITTVSETAVNERQKVVISLLKKLESDNTYGVGLGEEYKNIRFGLYAAEPLTAADGTEIPQDGLLEIVGIDENGLAVFTADVPAGAKLYVKEVATDAHYLLSDAVYPVAFDYEDVSVAFVQLVINNGEVIENTIIRGSIHGLKVDEDNTPVAGAVFGLFKANETEFTEENALATATPGEDGVFTFENIPYGDWIVRELSCPAHLVLSEESYKVTVSEKDQIIEITVVNKFLTGKVQVRKVSSKDHDKLLSGAEFVLYLDVNGNKAYDPDIDTLYGELSEADTGVYELSGLKHGGYLLLETKAPDGFTKDDRYFYFPIQKDGETVIVENEIGVGFTNEPIPTPTPKYPDSPQTGDNSKLWLWILLASGSLTVLITVSIVSRKKRKAL